MMGRRRRFAFNGRFAGTAGAEANCNDQFSVRSSRPMMAWANCSVEAVPPRSRVRTAFRQCDEGRILDGQIQRNESAFLRWSHRMSLRSLTIPNSLDKFSAGPLVTPQPLHFCNGGGLFHASPRTVNATLRFLY